MLNADRAPYFETCPRCGEGGFESLSTHSHCVGCQKWLGEDDEYDQYDQVPRWAIDFFKGSPIRKPNPGPSHENAPSGSAAHLSENNLSLNNTEEI